MKTKFKSVFKATLHPALPALLLSVLTPLSGQAGSLWREAVTDERGMFADKRAHRLGDIVTIVVTETANSTKTVALNGTKANTGDPNGLAAGVVNQLINAASNQQSSIPAGDRRKFPSNLLPKASGGPSILGGATRTSTNTTGNAGDLTNTQTLNSTMAVQVIDVLPNGNLVIEGIRQVSFSKERQFASLRGIIRPTDVLADNTIASSKIADARIDLVSEGTLTDTQKKGWLMRLDEKISPY